MLKRIFDIVASLVGLIVFTPLLLITAILVKSTSKGPVFFCQTRVGKDGLDFILYKFRSMTHLDEATKGSFDIGNNSRVTKIGKFIRKTKIDELPQLWNVLWGDMSFVGPRPEVRKWVDTYPERWRTIFQVRPGISDEASIVFRNEEELLSESSNPEEMYRLEILPRKLDLYDKYVQTQSFGKDICIIFQSIYAILFK